MIQCKKCGAQLDINTRVCPYCGTVNDEAVEHVEKMQHFEKDYASTKKAVYTKVKTFSKGYGDLSLLILLLVTLFIAIFAFGMNYSISDKLAYDNYVKNSESINQEFKELLDKGEFSAFKAKLDTIERATYIRDFSSYRKLLELIRSFEEVQKATFDYHFAASQYDDPLSNLASNLNDYYTTWNLEYMEETEENYEADVDLAMTAFLRHYLYLNDEDIAALKSGMSESEIANMLFVRLENNENEVG